MRASGRRDSGEGSEAVAGDGHRRRHGARHGSREHGEQRGLGAAVDGGSLGKARTLPRQRGAEGFPLRRHGRPRQVLRGGGGGGHLRHGCDRGEGRRRNPAPHPVAVTIPCRSPPPVVATAAQSVTPVARDTKKNTRVNGPYQALSHGTCIYNHAKRA